MSIQLKEITQENWEDCIQLTVADDQKGFVASNLYSLAESKYETSFKPLAIYNDAIMVGFLMYGQDPDDGQFWLVRLMTDKNHQGKGFAKEATKQLIQYLRDKYEITSLKLGYKPDNHGAAQLYESLGFVKTGDIEHGEVIALLSLSDNE